MIKEENYSIQAKNLLDFLIQDYSESLKDFHQDNFYLHEIKKFRFNINNRIRKLLDIAEVKNNPKDSFYHIIVFNTEYNNLITTLNFELGRCGYNFPEMSVYRGKIRCQ